MISQRGRPRRGLPRWLLLLVVGAVIGASGLFAAQKEFGPRLLSVEESRRIVDERDAALAAQRRVEAQSAETSLKVRTRMATMDAELAAARLERDKQAGALKKAEEMLERLRKDLALYEEVLPPDPRGNAIGVRAAKLEREQGDLAYHVLLTRDAHTSRPFAGVMKLVVSGQRASGATDTVTLGPVPVKVGGYQHVKGTLPLPKGFVAKQTSIQVLDDANGNSVGMRIINVQ
ncbi:MAG: DUF6776 family protein [Lautropia sp.]